MGLGRSLGNLFRNWHGADSEATHQAQHHRVAPHRVTQDDALIYLEKLTSQYRLTRKLVFAVADAESSVNPSMEPQHNSYKDRHGHPHHSTDYGIMQINDKTWFGKSVKDANGHPFKITEEVKHDWKANARAGVAILRHAYDLAALSGGPGTTPEDIAIDTYSVYNHGEGSWHKFLGKRPDGLPKDNANRNFAVKYKQWP